MILRSAHTIYNPISKFGKILLLSSEGDENRNQIEIGRRLGDEITEIGREFRSRNLYVEYV